MVVRLPSGQRDDGQPTRAFGFLIYFGVRNGGLRKVQVTEWHLYLTNRLYHREELLPLNMGEMEFHAKGFSKFIPVFGQRGVHFNGDTLVDSGCSISGAAFYRYECYGGAGWDPLVVNGHVNAKLVIKDVFGNKAEVKILLREKKLEEVRRLAPEIGEIDEVIDDSTIDDIHG